MIKGLKLFNVSKIMKSVKAYYQEKLTNLIHDDISLANNKLIDNTHILKILGISYFLKTMRLVIIILNISYFLGVIWFVIVECEKDFFNDVKHYGDDEEYLNEFSDTFQVYFDIYWKEPREVSIILTYFSFTSLSTVGFGDYHPRSNIERMMGAFILLSGVATFSYIMGNFIDILSNMQEFFAGLDDGD